MSEQKKFYKFNSKNKHIDNQMVFKVFKRALVLAIGTVVADHHGDSEGKKS